MAQRTTNKLSVFLISLALATSLFIAYEPMRHNDFVEYDDTVYITENPNVRNGMSGDSVIKAFTEPHAHMWHPITTLSHIADSQIFGLNPFWHHFVSLAIHIANAILLFLILNWTTKSFWASAFAAAVFALHPLQVESVAWAAERKNLLSGFFYFLTIIVYIRFAERPNIKRYLSLIAIYALCIMSKPTVVILPFALLLLDFWPLGRLLPVNTDKKANNKIQRRTLYRLVLEKIPLFILSAILCVITFFAQRSSSAMAQPDDLSAVMRLENALISYMKYIEKIFWPSKLALLYPYRYGNIPIYLIFISVLLILAISVFAVLKAKKYKYVPVGWFWFLGTLVPVIGVIQVGMQSMADRYTYLPAIGIYIIVAWGAAELREKWRIKKIWPAIAAISILTALLICTRTQVRYWQNSASLYKHAAETTENNFSMIVLYGNTLSQKGQYNEAIAQFNKALQIHPRYADAYSGLGMAYMELGKRDLASAYFNKGIELNPDSMDNYNNLAWLLVTKEKVSPEDANRAVELAEKACKLSKYENAQCLDTLAAAYACAGRFDEAVKLAEKGLNIAKSKGWDSAARQIQDRIKLFQSHQRYRGK